MKNLIDVLLESKQSKEDIDTRQFKGNHVFMMFDSNSGIVDCFDAYEENDLIISWGYDVETAHDIITLKVGEVYEDESGAIIVKIIES